MSEAVEQILRTAKENRDARRRSRQTRPSHRFPGYGLIPNPELRALMESFENKVVNEVGVWPTPARPAVELIANYFGLYGRPGWRNEAAERVFNHIKSTRLVMLYRDPQAEQSAYYLGREGFRMTAMLTWAAKKRSGIADVENYKVNIRWQAKVKPFLIDALGTHPYSQLLHDHMDMPISRVEPALMWRIV